MCANIDAACCPVPTTRAAPQPASSTVLLDGPAQHKRGVTTAPAVRMPRACDNQRGGGDSTRRVLGAPDERTARHARIALAATAPVAPAAMRVALGMSSSRGGPICVKGQFVLKKKKTIRIEFFFSSQILVHAIHATPRRPRRPWCASVPLPPPRWVSLCDDDLN
jgi:hypothetical protein